MDLICANDGDVPLWMRIGSGNESDQKQFVLAMKEFKNQLNFDSLMVADSGTLANFKPKQTPTSLYER
ncbi:MAG: hypothetical protein F6K06_08825 [Okeania sp. SIO1H4]|nr:hypothetical protein [Okeania sp. SIO1H4]NES92307.1 hypothetical protein [Okeania sp. SIO2B9]